jgi:hypothetical protein
MTSHVPRRQLTRPAKSSNRKPAAPSPELLPRFSPIHHSLPANCFIVNYLRTLHRKTPGVAYPIRHRSPSVTLEVRCNTISTQLNLERKALPSHASINRETNSSVMPDEKLITGPTSRRPNAPDSEVLAYAAAHGFVVLMHDLDFGAILAVTRGEKPSVVQIKSETRM